MNPTLKSISRKWKRGTMPKENKIKCVDCLYFKIRTITREGAQAVFVDVPKKVQKILEQYEFVIVYRCAVGELCSEVYIENKTVQNKINKNCKKAVSMEEDK